MKKDILFVCQYFYPEYISSATLPYDTAKKLAENGYTVEALVGYPVEYNLDGKVPLNEFKEGIKINRLKYITLDKRKKLSRLVNYISFTVAVLLRLYKFKQFKSVIFYSNPPLLPFVATLAKKIFGTKLIFVSYDVYPEIAIATNIINRKSAIAKTMNYINAFLFNNVDKVVALSSEMKNFLINNRNLNTDVIEVIPNWFEPQEIKNLDYNDASNNIKELFQENVSYISYFGNMGICQDIDTILSSIITLKHRSDIKFVFAGHGNKLDLLKERIREENLKNVIVLEFLHGIDYQYALKKSDVLLVSLAEGVSSLAVPSKTYSYMMASKPIIAIMNRNTDIANILEDRFAGCQVDNGDYKDLAQKIEFIIESENVKYEYSKNCETIFRENYTTEICTQKYVEIFKEILGD